jgi:hypothetical protein
MYEKPLWQFGGRSSAFATAIGITRVHTPALLEVVYMRTLPGVVIDMITKLAG